MKKILNKKFLLTSPSEYLLKSIFAVIFSICLIIGFQNSANALVGGPFQNDQFNDFGTQGTYIATIRASNTVGSMTFSLGDNVESYGTLSLFRQGVYYRGSSQGGIDIVNKKVFGYFVGVDITTISSNLFFAVVSNNESASTTLQTNSLNNFASTDQENVNGSFDVKITQSHPIFRFQGDGTGYFITIEDARLPQTSSLLDDFDSITILAEDIDTIKALENTANPTINTKEVKLKISGYRSSIQGLTVLSNTARINVPSFISSNSGSNTNSQSTNNLFDNSTTGSASN